MEHYRNMFVLVILLIMEALNMLYVQICMSVQLSSMYIFTFVLLVWILQFADEHWGILISEHHSDKEFGCASCCTGSTRADLFSV